MPIKKAGSWRSPLCEEVRKRYDLCLDAYRPYWQAWVCAQNYVDSNQWVMVDRDLNVLSSVPEDPGALTLVLNQIRSMVDSAVAVLVPQDFSPATRFVALNQDAKRKARAQDRLLEETSARLNYTSMLRTSARDLLKHGLAVTKVMWRPSDSRAYAGNKALDVDKWGGYVYAYNVHPLRWCPAPWSTKEYVPWVIEVHSVHRDQLETDYPGVEDAAQGATRAASLASGKAGLPCTADVTPEYMEQMVIVYEMYELPTPRFKKGRFVKCTDNKVLYDSSAHRDFDGVQELPYVWATLGNGSGNLIGYGLVRDGIDAQNQLNCIASDAARKLRRKLNAPYACEGSVEDPEKWQAGHLVRLKTGEKPPQEVETGNIPPETSWVLNLFTQMIGSNIGLHDISLGKAPQNIESGRGLEILRNQDATKLQEAAAAITGLASGGWRRMLIEYRLNAKPNALYQTNDVDESKGTLDLILGAISEFDVRVDPIPGYLQSRPAYQQKMLQLWQLGVLQQAGVDAEAMLDVFDLPSSGNQHDDEIRYIRQENEMLMLGILVAPKPYENLPLHLKGHKMYLLSDEVRAAAQTPEGQAGVARVEEHLWATARMTRPPTQGTPGPSPQGQPADMAAPGMQGAGPDMTAPLDASGVQTEEYQTRETAPTGGGMAG